MREIGSDFYLHESDIELLDSDHFTPSCTVDSAPHTMPLSLGRDAIGLCLDDLTDDAATALVPAYTCKSVLAPFLARGYRLVFYDVDACFRVAMSTWNQCIEDYDVDVLLFHPYFGFDTVILDEPWCHDEVKVIYDATQSWSSGWTYDFADYEVVSLRKWGPLPDGAYATKYKGRFAVNAPSGQDRELLRYVMDAYRKKARYLDHHLGDKSAVLAAFHQVKRHIADGRRMHRMSDLSQHLLTVWEREQRWEQIAAKRRANYRYLVEHLDWEYVGDPYFVLGDAVPLYLPFRVKRGTRGKWQQAFAKHDVYCPIIWPMSDPVREASIRAATRDHYEGCLCFPIDQRYGEDDMARIVHVLRAIVRDDALGCFPN
ncbi:MAG: hypothetical protein ACOYH4_04085 [Saccharofermentanales bacterium]|jgi:dTDP-4-amino-4,6-dideoxygalactose transaminase